MDQNFLTSFIPKKPIISEKIKISRPIGFLMVIASVIFFGTILSFGGFYFYKEVLTKKIVSLEESLFTAKNSFEPAKIAELQILDKRLRASNEILSNHIAISPIFKILSELTMKTIRYTNFNYEIGPGNNPKVFVKLSGQTISFTLGYRAIATQAEIFAKNKNLIDPVFSNLSLDSKGNVLFDLEFSVDPVLVNYKEILKTKNQQIKI